MVTKPFLIRSLAALVILVGMAWLGSTFMIREARAAPPTCFPNCDVYTIAADNIQPSVSWFEPKFGFSGTLYYFNQTGSTWKGYVCVGNAFHCSASNILNPQIWKQVGSQIDGSPIINFNYLEMRSGRTYQNVFLGAISGVNGASARTVGVGPIQTLPGYQSPTDLNLQITNITDNSATVSWQTPYDGSTVIWYRPVLPPTSYFEYDFNIPSGTFMVTDLEIFPDGRGWALINNGMVFKRFETGGWVGTAATGSKYARALTATSSERAWFANGNIVEYTTNGGTSWVSTNIGVIENINDIYSATPTTAWVATDNGKIFFLDQAVNPTTWTLKYTASPAVPFQSIMTLDNRSVWAIADGGTLVSTTDGWSTPSKQTVGPGGESMRSIDTLDGQTLWIAGTGRLYISTNGGSNWTSRVTTPGIHYGLKLLSPTLGWFLQNGKLYSYDSSTSTLHTAAQADGFENDTASIGFVNGGYLIVGDQKERVGRHIQIGTLVTDPTLVKDHTYTFPLGSLPAGQKIEMSLMSDFSGTFASFTTTSPDTTRPTISITNPPADLVTNNPSLNVQGTAQDFNGTSPGVLQSVVLTRNLTPVPVTAPGVPGAATVNWSAPVTLVAGVNNFEATARDASNNLSTPPATRQVILDQQAPTVTISTPGNNDTVNTATITANGTATDNQQVRNPMEYSLNSGSRQTFTVTPGANVNWTIAALGPLNLGSNTLTVYAKDEAGNEGQASVDFTYAEPTFTLAVAPASQTKNPGDTATYTVTATSVNGFAGNVSLTLSGAPLPSTTNFAPNPIVLAAAGPPVSSTLTIATTSSTATGTFNLTITGTGGGKTATANATLVLTSFDLTALPGTQSIVGGQPTSYTIRAISVGGFNGTVTYSLSAMPSGVTGSLAANSISLAPGGTIDTTLNIDTQPSAATGSHTITVTGTSGGLVKNVSVTLNISAPPDISLTVNPGSQTIVVGGSATYNGNVTALNGFNQSVNVSLTSAPSHPGLTWSIVPNSFTPAAAPGTAFSITVNTTGTVAPGLYTLTVKAENAGATVSKSVQVTLQVDPDTTPPVISNIVATPNFDRVTITWQTNEPANSAIAIYILPGLTLGLVGAISDAAYCTSACHNLLYQPLSPLTIYYFTVTSCDQAGNCRTETSFPDGPQAGQALVFTTLEAPDTIPPNIDVLSNPLDSDVVGGNVLITGQASDDKNMAEVQITIQPVAGGAPTNMSASCTGLTCNFSANWSTVGIVSGDYTITVVARDAASNLSGPVSVTVTVDNDPPNLTCEVVATPTPVAGATNCGGGQCWQAVITWCTDKPATTEVDYGTSVSCGVLGCTYPQGPVYGDPVDPAKLSTSHSVTLTNLDANQLYHYRITSCKLSGACTH